MVDASPAKAWGVDQTRFKTFTGNFKKLRCVFLKIEQFLGHGLDDFAPHGFWDGRSACKWCGGWALEPLKKPNIFIDRWQWMYTCDTACMARYLNYFHITDRYIKQLQEDMEPPSNVIEGYTLPELFEDSFIGWD